MSADRASRPTLAAWMEEYGSIEDEYLNRIRSLGVDFASRHENDAEVRRLRNSLEQSGARIRNGGASICVNALSTACVACTGDCGSKTFFLSLKCNRDCYFCFNSNQANHGDFCSLNESWRRDVEAYFDSIGGAQHATHIGLTGGEPLLHEREAVAFVSYVHSRAPHAHIRLYTAGDFLTEETLRRLRDAGLSELRLSVKLDSLDSPERSRAVIDAAASLVSRVARYIPQAMVEMPVIPGTDSAMRDLLCALDAAGAFGINLLEFGYPFNNWEAFARRGFQVKNPPFPVLYNWEYAGGLPIESSELLALSLVQFSIDKGLGLGVHYCSLENKNRDQVVVQNRAYVPNPAVYEQDPGDFFYKTIKVFDGDIAPARAMLTSAGLATLCTDGEDCLMVNPSCADALISLPIAAALSSNIVERRDGETVMREVSLEIMEEVDMKSESQWGLRATAWELAALSLRYPEEALIDAVASGQWAAAAHEVVASLGVALSREFDEFASDACEMIREQGGVEQLNTEATRLFVGSPHAVCSPYEGVRRSLCTGGHPLLFVNRYSMEVERFCKACGFIRPEGTNEPLDHVATECELLEKLAFAVATGSDASALPAEDLPGGSPAAAYEQFWDEHASAWFAEFSDALGATSTHPLYRATALYLDAISR